VGITLPSAGLFQKEQELYKMAHEHHLLSDENKYEDRDISYKVSDEIINPYHLFDIKELQTSLQNAGFQPSEFKIFVSTIKHPTELSQSSDMVDCFDYIGSTILSHLPISQSKISKTVTHIGAIATKEKKNDESPSTKIENAESESLLRSSKSGKKSVKNDSCNIL
jgi:hypothetical protein